MSRQYGALIDLGITDWKGDITKLGYDVLEKIEAKEWDDME